MATFVLIHGAGFGGWSWHLVEAALRRVLVFTEKPGRHEVRVVQEVADAVDARARDIARPQLRQPLVRRTARRDLGDDRVERVHVLAALDRVLHDR